MFVQEARRQIEPVQSRIVSRVMQVEAGRAQVRRLPALRRHVAVAWRRNATLTQDRHRAAVAWEPGRAAAVVGEQPRRRWTAGNALEVECRWLRGHGFISSCHKFLSPNVILWWLNCGGEGVECSPIELLAWVQLLAESHVFFFSSFGKHSLETLWFSLYLSFPAQFSMYTHGTSPPYFPFEFLASFTK